MKIFIMALFGILILSPYGAAKACGSDSGNVAISLGITDLGSHANSTPQAVSPDVFDALALGFLYFIKAKYLWGDTDEAHIRAAYQWGYAVGDPDLVEAVRTQIETGQIIYYQSEVDRVRFHEGEEAVEKLRYNPETQEYIEDITRDIDKSIEGAKDRQAGKAMNSEYTSPIIGVSDDADYGGGGAGTGYGGGGGTTW